MRVATKRRTSVISSCTIAETETEQQLHPEGLVSATHDRPEMAESLGGTTNPILAMVKLFMLISLIVSLITGQATGRS